MTASEWAATAATAMFLATAGRAIAVPSPVKLASTQETAEDEVQDSPGQQRPNEAGLCLVIGSFALMSFMVYRWISEEDRPPAVFDR